MNMQQLAMVTQPSIVTAAFETQVIENTHFMVAVKDTATGKYTVCNSNVAALASLKINEYCGKTAYEVQDILRPKHRAVTDRALAMDHRLIIGACTTVKYKHMWFTGEKSIFIEQVCKTPIVNKRNKIIAILCCGYDITDYANLPYLFSLYEHYHPVKEAIWYFLKHLGFKHYFTTLPTRKELIILIAMQTTSNAKALAKRLNIKPKTVDEAKARLRDKLRFVGLDDLLINLRMRCEYTTLQ